MKEKNIMPAEQNHGLEFKLETVMSIYQDGRLVAIEYQNGHITRYKTTEATKTDSLDIFGVNKVR